MKKIANNKKVFSLYLFLLLSFGLTRNSFASFKSCQQAIEEAKLTNKYLFVVFYEEKDSYFNTMNIIIKDFMKMQKDKVFIYKARISDTKEDEIVTKYRVRGAPLPLLLVFAPNGVITGGYPRQVNAQQLKTAFPSELILKILKPIQEGKLVLILLQNEMTRYNNESAKIAQEFSNTKGLQGLVDIIKTDPNSEDSKELLTQLKMISPVVESTIVMIVPPGRVGGIFPGKTDVKKLLNGLKACTSGTCCGTKR